MLKNEDIVSCPWCLARSQAKVWNEVTYAECASRDMRRAYTPIFNENTFKEKAETFYKCPVCEKWSRGSTLNWARATTVKT